jgi:hypothetical protein
MHKLGTVWTYYDEDIEDWQVEIVWTDLMDDFDEDEQGDLLLGLVDHIYEHFDDEDEEEEEDENWDEWF